MENRTIHIYETDTKPLNEYIEKQNFKWLACCIGMENDTLQKQSLFMKNR